MELFQHFIEDTKTNLENIEESVLALEKNHGGIELINNLLTQFHTIKGGAKLLELNEMNKLCHAVESFLEDAGNRNVQFGQTQIELLFECKDILKKLFDTLLRNIGSKKEGKPIDLKSEYLIKTVLKKLSFDPDTEPINKKEEKNKNLNSSLDAAKNIEANKQKENHKVSSLCKFLTFRLDNEFYALNIGCVHEIISMLDITPVPQTSNFLMGVINLRGTVVPVIDMRLRFGIPYAEYNEETSIIIIKGKKGLIGFIVDTVSEVISANESSIDEAPDFGNTVNVDFVTGILKANGEVKIMIDIEKILTNGIIVVE